MKRGKFVGAVETVLEHCESKLKFPDYLAPHVLESNLDFLESVIEKIENKVEGDNEGDFATEIDNNIMNSVTYICKTSVGNKRPDFSRLVNKNITQKEKYDLEYQKFDYENVLLKRNLQMSTTIDKIIQQNDKVKFFAVGVAHYLGDDSVVAQLQRRGYHVTRMMATDSVLQIT